MVVRRRHFRALVACLGLAAPLCGRGADPPAVPATKENISIQKPHGWQDVPDAKVQTASRAPQLDKDQTGGFQALLTLSTEAGQIDSAGQQGLMAQQFTGYRATDQPKGLTINGAKGVYFGGTFTHNNTPLRTRVYLFPMNNKTCIITFTCLASRWAAYQQELEACVSTLTLKG